jgi:hypothetical protein
MTTKRKVKTCKNCGKLRRCVLPGSCNKWRPAKDTRLLALLKDDVLARDVALNYTIVPGPSYGALAITAYRDAILKEIKVTKEANRVLCVTPQSGNKQEDNHE